MFPYDVDTSWGPSEECRRMTKSIDKGLCEVVISVDTRQMFYFRCKKLPQLTKRMAERQESREVGLAVWMVQNPFKVEMGIYQGMSALKVGLCSRSHPAYHNQGDHGLGMSLS